MACCLMATTRKYDINANLVFTVVQLSDKATSAAQMSNSKENRMPSLTHSSQHFSRMVSVDALGEHDGFWLVV